MQRMLCIIQDDATMPTFLFQFCFVESFKAFQVVLPLQQKIQKSTLYKMLVQLFHWPRYLRHLKSGNNVLKFLRQNSERFLFSNFFKGGVIHNSRPRNEASLFVPNLFVENFKTFQVVLPLLLYKMLPKARTI